MSIWCSWEHVGTDLTPWQELDGTPLPVVAQRGTVLSYAEGFSNHYPDATGEYERPAEVDIATVAPWCVPGHNQDGTNLTCTGCEKQHDGDVGAWLRLGVNATQTVNFWEKDDAGNPTVVHRAVSVVLDREAAESLRDDLTEWLGIESVSPVPPSDGA